MPTPIDDVESGDIPDDDPSVPLQIAVFLHAQADHAFTRTEIAEAIDADPNTVGTALSQLKQATLVRHRGAYWAITEDTEALQAAYDLHLSHEPHDAVEEQAYLHERDDGG